MKISRKMKKFFVSFLTATLSIIMLVTQVSALNIVSCREYFEHEGVVDAVESMSWNITRNIFSFSVDLECYECDNVDIVQSMLELYVYYPSSQTPVYYNRVGDFVSEDTWDSDELLIDISNFDRGYDLVGVWAEITYNIIYDNGDMDLYVYTYEAYVTCDDIEYERNRELHAYIYAEDE